MFSLRDLASDMGPAKPVAHDDDDDEESVSVRMRAEAARHRLKRLQRDDERDALLFKEAPYGTEEDIQRDGQNITATAITSLVPYFTERQQTLKRTWQERHRIRSGDETEHVEHEEALRAHQQVLDALSYMQDTLALPSSRGTTEQGSSGNRGTSRGSSLAEVYLPQFPRVWQVPAGTVPTSYFTHLCYEECDEMDSTVWNSRSASVLEASQGPLGASGRRDARGRRSSTSTPRSTASGASSQPPVHLRLKQNSCNVDCSQCACLVRVKREPIPCQIGGPSGVTPSATAMENQRKVLARWPSTSQEGGGGSPNPKLQAVLRAMAIEVQKREEWNRHVAKYNRAHNTSDGRYPRKHSTECTSPQTSTDNGNSHEESVRHTSGSGGGEGSSAPLHVPEGTSLYWPARISRLYAQFHGDMFADTYKGLGLLQQQPDLAEVLATALSSRIDVVADVLFTFDEVSEQRRLCVAPRVLYPRDVLMAHSMPALSASGRAAHTPKKAKADPRTFAVASAIAKRVLSSATTTPSGSHAATTALLVSAFAFSADIERELATVVEEAYRLCDAEECAEWKAKIHSEDDCPLLVPETFPDVLSIANYSFTEGVQRRNAAGVSVSAMSIPTSTTSTPVPFAGGNANGLSVRSTTPSAAAAAWTVETPALSCLSAESEASRRREAAAVPAKLNHGTISNSPIRLYDILAGPTCQTQTIVFLYPTKDMVTTLLTEALKELVTRWLALRQALLDRLVAYEEQLPITIIRCAPSLCSGPFVHRAPPAKVVLVEPEYWAVCGQDPTRPLLELPDPAHYSSPFIEERGKGDDAALPPEPFAPGNMNEDELKRATVLPRLQPSSTAPSRSASTMGGKPSMVRQAPISRPVSPATGVAAAARACWTPSPGEDSLAAAPLTPHSRTPGYRPYAPRQVVINNELATITAGDPSCDTSGAVPTTCPPTGVDGPVEPSRRSVSAPSGGPITVAVSQPPRRTDPQAPCHTISREALAREPLGLPSAFPTSSTATAATEGGSSVSPQRSVTPSQEARAAARRQQELEDEMERQRRPVAAPRQPLPRFTVEAVSAPTAGHDAPSAEGRLSDRPSLARRRPSATSTALQPDASSIRAAEQSLPSSVHTADAAEEETTHPKKRSQSGPQGPMDVLPTQTPSNTSFSVMFSASQHSLPVPAAFASGARSQPQPGSQNTKGERTLPSPSWSRAEDLEESHNRSFSRRAVPPASVGINSIHIPGLDPCNEEDEEGHMGAGGDPRHRHRPHPRQMLSLAEPHARLSAVHHPQRGAGTLQPSDPFQRESRGPSHATQRNEDPTSAPAEPEKKRPELARPVPTRMHSEPRPLSPTSSSSATTSVPRSQTQPPLTQPLPPCNSHEQQQAEKTPSSPPAAEPAAEGNATKIVQREQEPRPAPWTGKSHTPPHGSLYPTRNNTGETTPCTTRGEDEETMAQNTHKEYVYLTSPGSPPPSVTDEHGSTPPPSAARALRCRQAPSDSTLLSSHSTPPPPPCAPAPVPVRSAGTTVKAPLSQQAQRPEGQKHQLTTHPGENSADETEGPASPGFGETRIFRESDMTTGPRPPPVFPLHRTPASYSASPSPRRPEPVSESNATHLQPKKVGLPPPLAARGIRKVAKGLPHAGAAAPSEVEVDIPPPPPASHTSPAAPVPPHHNLLPQQARPARRDSVVSYNTPPPPPATLLHRHTQPAEEPDPRPPVGSSLDAKDETDMGDVSSTRRRVVVRRVVRRPRHHNHRYGSSRCHSVLDPTHHDDEADEDEEAATQSSTTTSPSAETAKDEGAAVALSTLAAKTHPSSPPSLRSSQTAPQTPKRPLEQRPISITREDDVPSAGKHSANSFSPFSAKRPEESERKRRAHGSLEGDDAASSIDREVAEVTRQLPRAKRKSDKTARADTSQPSVSAPQNPKGSVEGNTAQLHHKGKEFDSSKPHVYVPKPERPLPIASQASRPVAQPALSQDTTKDKNRVDEPKRHNGHEKGIRRRLNMAAAVAHSDSDSDSKSSGADASYSDYGYDSLSSSEDGEADPDVLVAQWIDACATAPLTGEPSATREAKKKKVKMPSHRTTTTDGTSLVASELTGTSHHRRHRRHHHSSRGDEDPVRPHRLSRKKRHTLPPAPAAPSAHEEPVLHRLRHTHEGPPPPERLVSARESSRKEARYFPGRSPSDKMEAFRARSRSQRTSPSVSPSPTRRREREY